MPHSPLFVLYLILKAVLMTKPAKPEQATDFWRRSQSTSPFSLLVTLLPPGDKYCLLPCSLFYTSIQLESHLFSICSDIVFFQTRRSYPCGTLGQTSRKSSLLLHHFLLGAFPDSVDQINWNFLLSSIREYP